ncbi:MAG: cobyric acid synthase [Candidatus Methanoplasma sp.]|jgi:adenosylcobyric acid synthase|nr:cobyric acid synthase [Candidatus Methanoplasma sp.]
MDNITKKVAEEIEKGWIGPDKSCSYHPCHFEGQDCTFCFCPFYPCLDDDFGRNTVSKKGADIWECTFCLFIHRPEVGKFVMSEFRRLGITDPKDPAIRAVFENAKRRFHTKGRALMILGATSDAGKSITVAAICRILHNRGYLVAPFKSQNMSLNSKVTRKGHEIAMIQTIQSKAAGLKNPDQHMNPILLKPKGDMISQVMVEGESYGDYNVEDYYGKFVPGQGIDIVKRNVDFLKGRYDFVVMEGAGSPAEINIYDRDIANIGAAKIAGAPCILVVNVEWGGAFAYAVGTVKLMPEEDRGRIKGIILNNIRGDISKLSSGARELERILGIPVMGLIPHISMELPLEDSEALRGMKSRGNGSMTIAVIKLPRIANFTDLDPLYMEDTTVRFVTDAEELEDSDAIIIPGTKNTIDDLIWLKDKGLDRAIIGKRGKIPILGICGGYQMMGRRLEDPNGIEGSDPGSFEGLGLFDNITRWGEYKKKVVQDEGTLLHTGEPITGYEIHMGMSEVNEEPLFNIKRFSGDEKEGSVREGDMLFGTYLHGILEKPAFRRFFLSHVKGGKAVLSVSEPKDYDDLIEENIRKLSSEFESNMDVDRLIRIMEGEP